VVSFVVLRSQRFHTETGTIKAKGHHEVVCDKTHEIMVGAEQVDRQRISACGKVPVPVELSPGSSRNLLPYDSDRTEDLCVIGSALAML
jgi:hypothetical protein